MQNGQVRDVITVTNVSKILRNVRRKKAIVIAIVKKKSAESEIFGDVESVEYHSIMGEVEICFPEEEYNTKFKESEVLQIELLPNGSIQTT